MSWEDALVSLSHSLPLSLSLSLSFLALLWYIHRISLGLAPISFED